MPLSNCTDEDVGYDIDTPGGPNAPVRYAAYASMGTGLGFLLCCLLAFLGFGTTTSALLGIAFLALGGGLLLWERQSFKPARDTFLLSTNGRPKRLLRAGTYRDTPKRFAADQDIVFCDRAGNHDIARVQIREDGSHVTIFASGAGRTAVATSQETKKVAPPIGLVSLHKEDDGVFRVDVLPEA